MDDGRLHALGLAVRPTPAKGRGVFATRAIPAGTLIDVSPVLLFAKDDYERHGRHTVLDHYTFVWRDGRMALALGLGSIFNHSSDQPNVTFVLDHQNLAIRYTTARAIQPDEELNIFYGTNLWFETDGDTRTDAATIEQHDAWRDLQRIGVFDSDSEEAADQIDNEKFDSVQDNKSSSEHTSQDLEMPFTRMRLSVDDDEELDGQVKLMDVWAVDMRDSKQTSQMIAFIKKADRELESLKHLKRARRSLDPTTNEPKVTVLLAPTTTTLPILPEGTLKPYTVSVPRFGSSTPEQIPLKNAFWPTVYAPSQVTREPEWSKEGVEWVRRGIERVVGEARRAKSLGELPVACYVASPERPEISYLSTDTRISTAHPLRHAVINTIKTIAAALPPSDDPSGPAPTPATPPTAAEDLGPPKPPARNGEAYLLTNLTLFTTHEPCIMCTMALLHSRLKQIFFVYDMPRTGGCGGCAGVVGLRGVNHRFTVWKWTEKLSELDGGDLCVDESVDI